MTEYGYGYTRGNCGYAGGYVQSVFSYILFRPVYIGYCDCGWNTGECMTFEIAKRTIMNHATFRGWGALAYSWSTHEGCHSWACPDLETAKRHAVSGMHSTDAQALVWGFNSFIAFASSKSSGRVGWSTGSDEKAVVKEAVKGCRQYGKGCKLQLLFHTANGNIVNNSPNAAPIEY